MSGPDPSTRLDARRFPIALTATMHTFDIELAHSDRGVYETLELRVARHPSESAAFMIVRVLAYCIEYAEGIAFSKGGLSSTASRRCRSST